jgi:hypothetical protein
MGLLASIFVIGSPAALAHHPEIAATVDCVDDNLVIEYTASSWATGAAGTNNDIGIYVGSTKVGSGAFTEANGYTFSGTIDAAGYAGRSVQITARADGKWGNGTRAGDARSTTVAVPAGCSEETTTTTVVEETTTTTVLETTTTVVDRNPSCADLGLGQYEVKDDNPGDDTTIGAVSFDYDGLRSVSVSTSGEYVIDGVIVKGGPDANVYTTGFSGMVAPVNPGGKRADISHVSVCYHDAPTPDPVTVSVQVGACAYGIPATPVAITIDPDKGAVVTITNGGGAVAEVASTTSLALAPGSYSWQAEAAAGHELAGDGAGVFQVGDCTPEKTRVSVELGDCHADESSLTEAFVAVGEGAVLRLWQGETLIGEYSSATRILLAPGEYRWQASALEGYQLVGAGRGELSVGDCTPDRAGVQVEVGECRYAEGVSATPVTVTIQGDVVVTIVGPGGPYPVSETDTLILAPGRYTWSATAGEGSVLVGTTEGSFDLVDCTPRCDAVIGDVVWLDTKTYNGMQDPGESPVPGVSVELMTADGAVVAATTTDNSGRYEFAGLCEGTYRARFELPDLAGYQNERWTTPVAGDARFDSDAGDDGLTGTISVVAGTDDRSWDAGIVADAVSNETVTTATTTPSSTTAPVDPTTSVIDPPATTVPPVTASTLPFTGFELQATALLALVLVAGGVALLAGAARREDADEDPLGTW